MTTTQKVVLGIAIVTLIGALIYYFTRDSGEKMTVRRTAGKPDPEADLYKPDPTTPTPTQPMRRMQPASEQVPTGVLVMFFAPWCGHCKTTEPTWAELTQNFDGYNGVQILKINGDENGQLAQLHGVGGFPTIKYCPQGLENPDGVVYQGDRSLNSLAEFLRQNA